MPVIYCLYWKGVKISQGGWRYRNDIFTPGWEYRGWKYRITPAHLSAHYNRSRSSMKWLMCRALFLHLSTSLGCFCPRTVWSQKNPDWTRYLELPLYMRCTYYTKDSQQGCSRLSIWFSLWGLGPWMNHLPPVWWSIFRCSFFMSIGVQFWYGGEGFFFMNFLSLSMFYILPRFCLLLFLSNWFTLK